MRTCGTAQELQRVQRALTAQRDRYTKRVEWVIDGARAIGEQLYIVVVHYFMVRDISGCTI